MSDHVFADTIKNHNSQLDLTGNLFEDVYRVGEQTLTKDLPRYGSQLLDEVMDDFREDPVKGAWRAAEVAGIAGALAIGTTASAPEVIGVCGAAAVLGTLHIVGEELKESVEDFTRNCKK